MAKFAAYGAALLINGVEVGQVTSISGPSLSLDTADVTTHDQTTAWEELVTTILRSGEISLDLVFDPADTEHIALLANLTGKAAETFNINFPDSAYTQWEFDAYVTAFEPSMPVGDALTATCTLKLSGTPVLSGTYTP